ncbi:MAG: hypothetical protein ACREHV_06835, partial [Rhizomicrobium sp.]
ALPPVEQRSEFPEIDARLCHPASSGRGSGRSTTGKSLRIVHTGAAGQVQSTAAAMQASGNSFESAIPCSARL